MSTTTTTTNVETGEILVKLSTCVIDNTRTNAKDFPSDNVEGCVIELSKLYTLFASMLSHVKNGQYICYGIEIITPRHNIVPDFIFVKLFVKNNKAYLILLDWSDNIGDYIEINGNTFTIDRLNDSFAKGQTPVTDQSKYTTLPMDTSENFSHIIKLIEQCYSIIMSKPTVFDQLQTEPENKSPFEKLVISHQGELCSP